MKIELTHHEFMNSYDWQEAFKYASSPSNPKTREVLNKIYVREEVAEILGLVEGENDGDSWVGVFRIKNQKSKNKFLVLRASCDYTGWGCQEDGSCDIADTLEDAIAFCLTQGERDRLND